jgi:hypothetical protein
VHVTQIPTPQDGDGAQAAQPATAEGPPQLPGGGLPSDAASAGAASSGHAAQASRSGKRNLWLASAVTAVLVVIGAGIWLILHGHQAGKIAFPATLLGVSRYNGPGARQLDHRIEASARASYNSMVTSPVAAVYGDPAGRGFAVVAGAACTSGPCVIGTSRQFVNFMRAYGYAGARSFPAGPGGHLLGCFPRARRSAQVIDCLWVDQEFAGAAAFIGGYASNLGDAAAKTRQIRAAIEH